MFLQVLQNLFISKLKIATEDSPDVAQYTHHRKVETIKIALTEDLNEARERFLTVSDPSCYIAERVRVKLLC